MKSVKYFLFVFSIVISALFSCRPKPIDIEVKPGDVKLVVFTQVIPNNVMIVTLTRSFSPLSGNTSDNLSSLLVSGATVQIKSNNQTYDCFESSPGIYISVATSSFVEGQEYELIAISGTDTVTSTSKMLPKVDFTTVLPSVEKNIGDTNVFVSFNFNDIASVSNWYLVNFYKKQANVGGIDGSNYFQNGSNSLIRSILLSDKEFNGVYHAKVELDSLKWNDSIVVTLSNIDEKYFNFLGFREGKGGVLSQMNIEPLSYPTNIKNGYGFFNTFYPDIKFFDLSQY